MVVSEQRARASAVLVLLLALASGCGGGAQFNGTDYRDKDVAFRLSHVPEGARQINSEDAKLAFQHDEAGATLAISARCGLDSDDVPLRALAQHLFLQLTERELLREEEFILDGRAALTMEMNAHLDGVRRRFLVTVLKKDGCVYDFLHVDGGGESSALVQSRAEFFKVVQGFSTLP